MEYLTQRQRVVSQNIANADTPGYRPQDLTPVDFGTTLKSMTGSKNVTMAATDAQHIGGMNDKASADEKKSKTVYEVAPAGNAVIMEEQLVNSNQTQMDYNLVTSLYQKNVNLIKLALGTGR